MVQKSKTTVAHLKNSVLNMSLKNCANKLLKFYNFVTLGSPGYGKGPLGLADFRLATRLPSQPPGPPGSLLVKWG